MSQIESIPQTWDDERDGRFFTLVARVFDPEWLEGATALLLSYDDVDALPSVAPTSIDQPAARTAPTPVPVRVRRAR